MQSNCNSYQQLPNQHHHRRRYYHRQHQKQHYTQRHYQLQRRYHHSQSILSSFKCINRKISKNDIIIWWLACLLLQVATKNFVVVVHANTKVVPLSAMPTTITTTPVIAQDLAETIATTSTITAPAAALNLSPSLSSTTTFIASTSHSKHNNSAGTRSTLTTTTTTTKNSPSKSARNGAVPHDGFSALDKEVVERLIKEWAPVVWLAPEEKFLPLGVDEFLNHVHPMDKGKTFIPGMPIGDSSEKAYLVTNAEIEELLENDNSFIYGRNPNESPVPIYAVVSLCTKKSAATSTTTATTLVNKDRGNIKTNMASAFTAQKQQQQYQLLPQTMMAPSTRGPYIPVFINPLEEHNNTLRRSSRLYPVFKRVRRNLEATADVAYMPSLAPSQLPPLAPEPLLLMNLPPKPIVSNFDLVLGETNADITNIGLELSPSTSMSTEFVTTEIPEEAASATYNNFIANLADNVKFSGELDNSINIDSSFNEPNEFKENIMQQANYFATRQKVPSFHVTFWMFYPYSQGKTMCTLSLGPLGSIPFPAVYGFCLGRRKDIGSHIGDWEHMSLFFNDAAEPEAMYVSAHDAGAYYTYNRLTGSFEFKKQETRKGILQRPNFPKTVTTFNNHPVLFAAKGSHGLWTAPGKHRFVKVARLYDVNGFGTPWNTWKAVEISYENIKSYGRSLIPPWLSFKGKWGNPKSKCHPFRRIGLNFCEYTDGPTGIPLKEPHFQCGTSYRRR